ncbi:DUF222 domain-containing protein [Demequina capsici]|uniref:DUF222 domain-containing protein n=1 Tax=Demequina capsici TaxID=3075620 RepID=A0AA96J9M7_9MICO|nr:DUF222 domain-containing protein [Demequina sp. PMTSA13]WNM26173.1 DUF222 domain-containing protein [Demequina sp. PMTSA13]
MISQVRGGSFASARRAIAAGEAFAPRQIAAGSDADAAPSGVSMPGDVRDLARGASDELAAGHPPTDPSPGPKCPEVARASLAGDLSVDAAGLIVAGLNSVAESVDGEYLADLERRLVSGAAARSAHEVQTMVARAVARVDAREHERRERKNHEERYLWWKQGHDGVVTLHGQLDAVTAAPVISVLEQMTTRGIRRQGRDEAPVARDTRTVGQIRADALFELARHALGCAQTAQSGVRTTMVIRMTLADLERGEGLGSIDGIRQPVSVRELRRLAGDAGVVPEVLGGDGEVLELGRERRLFTRAQRLALLERDGGCAKCHAPPEHCEAHHIIGWEHGGRTDLTNGVMLCTRCHHDVHRDGWRIDADKGEVKFTPPPELHDEGDAITGGVAAWDLAGLRASQPPGVDNFRDDDMVRLWEAQSRVDAERVRAGLQSGEQLQSGERLHSGERLQSGERLGSGERLQSGERARGAGLLPGGARLHGSELRHACVGPASPALAR